MTSSPEALVVLMYEAALARLDRATTAWATRRYADGAKAMSQAFAIVAELRNCLDLDRGGEIAEELSRLYGFVLERITRANATRDAAMVGEARGVLSRLKEGWDSLVGAA